MTTRAECRAAALGVTTPPENEDALDWCTANGYDHEAGKNGRCIWCDQPIATVTSTGDAE